LGYIELTRLLQNKVIPDGGVVGINVFPNGMYFLVDIEEQTFYERAELQISAIDSHHINLGVYAYQSDMAKREGRDSVDDMQTFNVYDILIDQPRNMYSLYADDLIDLSERTSVQIGIKYDHYNDVESQLSPRIALVHRYDDKNIYKFMYTHSYREPSWREQYLTRKAFYSSTLDIKPETVDAYELGYIRKIDLKSHVKVNTYYLSNKDQIHAQNITNTFQNSGDNNIYGFEIEFKKTFNNSDQIYLNYSYVGGENVGEELANSAKKMAKVYYVRTFSDALSLSTIAKMVDEKDRIEGDLRGNVHGYALVDLSINYQLKPEKVRVNLSVKNIFDKAYYLPSPDNTYPEDFEQEGRSMLLGLSVGF
jgi:iron complex outermembrane receptor protein